MRSKNVLSLEYGPKADLDETDWKILKLLEEDARMSISRMARRLNLSRDKVKYRLKRLVSEKIVLSFMVMTNLPKLGYTVWGYMHVRFANLTRKREQDFINHVRSHPNILFAHSTLGAWDFGVEFFAKDPGHFFQLQKDLKETFSDIIKDAETGSFVDVYKTLYVPPRP
ncbi:Lrp/AsnC family transcriptional regulator [Candidatus Micrarchaeota archaeon]|nr:Lrp/AsnC family transcriptional regulator [Candidatus Micrarchaeota archaeon]